MIYSCQRLTVFSLRTPIWQRFTKVFCLRSYHSERTGSRLIPLSQTLSGEDSTWMVDRLEIPRVVDFFSFLFDYTIDLFWLFQNTSFVLSRKRENKIVVIIGTLLHHIHVEF